MHNALPQRRRHVFPTARAPAGPHFRPPPLALCTMLGESRRAGLLRNGRRRSILPGSEEERMATVHAHDIRAPRGTALSCRGWQQEAALRMLMNNLDPEVAERPEDLVV